MKKLSVMAALALSAAMVACGNGGSKEASDLKTKSDTVSYYLGRIQAVEAKKQLTADPNVKFNMDIYLAAFEKSSKMQESELMQTVQKLGEENSKADEKRKNEIANEQTGLVNGVMVASSLKEMSAFSGDSLSFDKFLAGFKEVMLAKENPDLTKENAYIDSYMKVIQEKENAMRSSQGVDNVAAGEEFLKKEMAADPSIKKTASGLAYKVIKAGKGTKLQESQVARVHYEGKLIDGSVFDSSRQRGEAAEFSPAQVIPGFKEGLLMMNPGSVYRFYIPGNLGYGEMGIPGGPIGPNEMLVFEVELLEIK